MTQTANLLDAAVLAGGLAARYNQPHRRYHTAEHIRRVLEAIDVLEPDPADQLALDSLPGFTTRSTHRGGMTTRNEARSWPRTLSNWSVHRQRRS